MKRFLILGAQGQLGVELQRAFQSAGHIIAMNRAECDLNAPDIIRAAMRNTSPNVILNAAAYTAVDRAESEPELAVRINGEAPGILAEEAKKRNALLIHYSTDYVFDGSKPGPWLEDDPPHPLNAYGASKLAGEHSIQHQGGQFLIFRTSWVYSPHGNNFLRTMLRLGREREELRIVNDQKGAPTSALALATATRRILDVIGARDPNAFAGLYHMTCAGETTWCGFAQAIFAKARTDKAWAAVTGIPSSEYPTSAARPANSVLSNQKLKAAFGIELPPWGSALEASLRTLNLA